MNPTFSALDVWLKLRSVDLKALQPPPLPPHKNLTGIQHVVDPHHEPLAHKELYGDGAFDNLSKYKELYISTFQK